MHMFVPTYPLVKDFLFTDVQNFSIITKDKPPTWNKMAVSLATTSDIRSFTVSNHDHCLAVINGK